MIHLFRLTLVGLVAWGGMSCKVKPLGRDLAQSPEDAYTKLAEVGRAGQAGGLYELLDIQSRWAVMSILKDQKAMCMLIHAHYPPDRKAAAAQRCQAAQMAQDDRTFFSALNQEMGLLKSLSPLRSMGAVKKKDEARVEIESEAGKLAFCREEQGWGYCGLSEQLEQLKVKTARDLISVQENAEAFKNR